MLCIVMCMAPVISAANVRAVAPETMEATSVALPEEKVNDTSTTVKVAEEEEMAQLSIGGELRRRRPQKSAARSPRSVIVTA